MKKMVITAILTLVCLLGLSAVAFAAESQTSLPAQESQQVQASSSETDAVVTPMTADTGVINADGVRLRSTPSTSGTVVGLLYKGYDVDILGTATGSGYTWYKVYCLNTGMTGYVVTSYVTLNPA